MCAIRVRELIHGVPGCGVRGERFARAVSAGVISEVRVYGVGGRGRREESVR